MAKASAKIDAATPRAPDAPSAPTAPVDPSIIGTINVTTPSFTLGEVRIVKFTVHQISFRTLCEAIDAARAARIFDRAPAKAVQKYIRREQMIRQVRAIDDTGTARALKVEDLMRIPRTYAVSIDAIVDISKDNAGEVVGEGDGSLTPITYRLGTPLTAPGGVRVDELEFLAPTMGQIEDVLAASNGSDQTLELLKIARPIVPDNPGLTRLTDQWIGMITIVDGQQIMDKVLPRFFD